MRLGWNQDVRCFFSVEFMWRMPQQISWKYGFRCVLLSSTETLVFWTYGGISVNVVWSRYDSECRFWSGRHFQVVWKIEKWYVFRKCFSFLRLGIDIQRIFALTIRARCVLGFKPSPVFKYLSFARIEPFFRSVCLPKFRFFLFPVIKFYARVSAQ